MFLDSGSMKTFYLLEKGLDASLVRQQVISDNIANVDTPNFKRTEVTFEAQMQRALYSENEPRFPVALTNKGHIDFFKPLDYRDVKAKLYLDQWTSFRNDRNNVDIEKEISDAVKNSLRYKAMAQSLGSQYKQIDMCLQG
jgi:flagellar basal-body rod protein FlgB